MLNSIKLNSKILTSKLKNATQKYLIELMLIII